MSEIQLHVYQTGGIDCQDKNCLFKRECSLHETAGQFRSEDGFTPEIIMWDDGTNECMTKDRLPDRKWHKDEIFQRNIPNNIDELWRGSLCIVDGDIRLSDEILYG